MALSTSSSFTPTDYKVSLIDYAHANSYADDLDEGKSKA